VAEGLVFAGTERGALACVKIEVVLGAARRQQEEIQAKMESDAAAVISKKVFATMPKPHDDPEYVFPLPNKWFVQRAHRGAVEDVVLCDHNPQVILSLGADNCVRLWSCEAGEPLGALEQGLPDGLAYEPEAPWLFPVDARKQVQDDEESILLASQVWAEPAEGEPDEAEAASGADAAGEQVRIGTAGASSSLLAGSGRASTGEMVALRSSPELRMRPRSQRESESSRGISRGPGTTKRASQPWATTGVSGASSSPLPTKDWLVGGAAESPAAGRNRAFNRQGSLPQLQLERPPRKYAQSGLKMSRITDNKKIVEAAVRLSSALGGVSSPIDH